MLTMKKLIVSGCSVTHGSELYHPFYHENNTIDAYPAVVANGLGIEHINLAMPGGSNEYIFHSLAQRIDKINATDIHSIIVAWTFVDRFYWKNGKRHWFFNPGWACTTEDLLQSGQYNLKDNGVSFSSDQEHLLPALKAQHRMLVENYFTDHQTRSHLGVKTLHYSLALRALCHEKNIKLVEIDAARNKHLNTWQLESLGLDYINQARHPNVLEHKTIGQYILDNFYKQH